jgi:phosphatidate cytidylyltransferase
VSTLQTRITFGVILFALFFGILWLDSLFDTDLGFMSLAIVAGGIGLYEFYHIAGKNGFSPFRISGIAAGIALLVFFWLSLRKDIAVDCHFFREEAMVILVFWLLLIQAVTRGTQDAIKNIAATIFGIFYVAFLLSFALALRTFPHGLAIVVLVLLVSKFGDIGGYLLGRKYGKHKLAKIISPNKTVEGACFSLASSILISVTFNLIPSIRVMSVPWAIIFGAVVGFSAMLGDLAESLLKRDAQVKDSGRLVPAFGGVLDVIDCLLVSMPVAYYLFVWGKLTEQ